MTRACFLRPAGLPAGASRELFLRAKVNEWTLVTTPYDLEEVLRTLVDLPRVFTTSWASLRPELLVMDDVLTIDRPSVFSISKDRPVLFSALARSDVLLTLDVGDFGGFIDRPFYGLPVLRPGAFLEKERAANASARPPAVVDADPQSGIDLY